MSDNTTPQPTETLEQHGEHLGETLAQAAQQEAGQTPDPSAAAAAAADKKKHVGLIVAIVAFAVVLIGAGAAYSALAPASEASKITATPAATQGSTGSTGQTDINNQDTNAGQNPNADSDVTAPAPSTDPDASQPGSAGDSSTSSSNTANTTAAPDFTMTDASGKSLTLADLEGKPMLLNFWASWCGPCKSEMPDIQAAYEKYGNDIAFVIVNMTGMSGETRETAAQFIADNGYTFPVYYDQDNSAAMAFGVNSIPQTYLVNAEGNIIGAAMGAMDTATIEQGIQMLQAS